MWVLSPILLARLIFIAGIAEYWCAVEDFFSRVAEVYRVPFRKHCVHGERSAPILPPTLDTDLVVRREWCILPGGAPIGCTELYRLR